MTNNRSLGMRSEAVRELNLTTILRKLHLSGPTSRSDLAQHTGLTRSAIGGLVGDLVEVGLVSEHRAEPDGTPGRPSAAVHPETTTNVVLAVEILVDSIAVTAVGLGGTQLQADRSDRAHGTAARETIADVAQLYRRVVSRLDPGCSIYAVGVAIPALIRRSDNQVVLAPNLGWQDLPLGALVLEAFDLDVPIVVDNEATLAALAESRRGVARTKKNVLCLWGEVGLGGGVISDGEVLRGAGGFAGEVGHVPINLAGRQCGCGAIGCLETEVGEEALLRRAGRVSDGGRSAMVELFEDAHAGVPAVLAALDEQGRWLGIGLAGLVNVMNPDVVVLGGFLADAMPFFSTTMHRELESRSLVAVRGTLEVLPALCGADAPLLGAAETAWDLVLANASASVLQRVSVAEIR